MEDKPSRAAAPILHPTQWGGGAERSEAEGGNPERPSRSRRKQGTTERARALRWVENSAEGLLWLELKGGKLGGHKFTRQLPIGPYFADFACRKQKLVVEVDGSHHAESPHDRRRDEFFCTHGWSTLRFWNTDVLKHRSSVCETILAALVGRLAENVTAADLRFVYAAGTRKDRPPLRSAPPTTSPSIDGAEERHPVTSRSALPLPPAGGEVASQSDDGVGEEPGRRTNSSYPPHSPTEPTS
ncbi:endonuclease domain-containing protein [Aquibium oceanicum]|uniref:endonuclease domain-containing protein n=1 Tax=Aquibium oceanicum TaxID=1670800 RepID=UPI0030013D89